MQGRAADDCWTRTVGRVGSENSVKGENQEPLLVSGSGMTETPGSDLTDLTRTNHLASPMQVPMQALVAETRQDPRITGLPVERQRSQILLLRSIPKTKPI